MPGWYCWRFRPADPGRYGRVITRDGSVERIVEWADASEAERAERLVQCRRPMRGRRRHDALAGRTVRADNAKGEYYLTDASRWRGREGARVAAVEAPAEELAGINSRVELAAAEAVVQARCAPRDGRRGHA